MVTAHIVKDFNGVLGNEIRDALIMGHPAVSAAVQEMLTRTEALYTLDLLKETNVTRGYGRQCTLYGPAKRRATMEKEVVMDDL